jgi:hypothetical protein
MIKIEISEALWFDAGHALTLAEVADLSGLPQEMLRQLADLDALPLRSAAGPTFSADGLELARTAGRLHQDLELDAGALALVLRLLERMRGLEAELQRLQARLPQHLL